MACTSDRPCGNVLRHTLTTFDARIYECLNAHTFRVERENKPRIIERELKTRKYRPSKHKCLHCRLPMEPGRQPSARLHIVCRDPYAAKLRRVKYRREHRRVS